MGDGGFILNLLFLGLLVAIIIWLLRNNLNLRNRGALSILNRRYASGDISRKQYEQLLKDIIRSGKKYP